MKSKFLLLILVLCSSVFNAEAQEAVDKMVKAIKKTERYEGANVPGRLIRWTARIAAWGNDDPQIDEILMIVKKVKSFTVASTSLDQKKYNNKAIVNNFVKKAIDDDGFEEYLAVKDPKSNFKILIKERKNVIKNLLILSADGRELSLVHLKTNLNLNDLSDINFGKMTSEVKKFKIDVKNEDEDK